MKIVLSAVGSRGDLQPLAALSGALQRRGHTVCLLGPPEASGLAQQQDVPYLPAGRDVMAWLQNFDVATIGVRGLFDASRDLIHGDLHQMAPLLFDAARGADVVVSAALQVLGPTAAELHGAASTYVYYAPCLLPSDEHPPLLVELQRLPRLANRAFHAVTLSFLNRVILPALNRERRAVSLAPHANMAHAMDRHLLLAWDRQLAAPPSDLDASWKRLGVAPRAFEQVGALLPAPSPRDVPLDPSLEAFAREQPCVYVGFGSMPDPSPQQTLAMVEDAAQRAGVRVVMLGRFEGSARVHVVPQAAHGALFPLMRAVVHHGGAGTTATASRAGVPQIVVPHFVDQPYWAHRVALRGVSAGTLRRRNLSADTLAAALKRALTDQNVQNAARQLAAELRHDDPLAGAVATIEGLGSAR